MGFGLEDPKEEIGFGLDDPNEDVGKGDELPRVKNVEPSDG